MANNILVEWKVMRDFPMTLNLFNFKGKPLNQGIILLKFEPSQRNNYKSN